MEARQKTMPRVIAEVWVAVYFGYITAVAAQLPPDVLVDQYLLRAERLMQAKDAKDAKGALEMMAMIVVLQEDLGGK